MLRTQKLITGTDFVTYYLGLRHNHRLAFKALCVSYAKYKHMGKAAANGMMHNEKLE